MNLTTWWPAGILALLLLPAAQACHRASYHYQPLSSAASPVAAPNATGGPQLLFLSFNMTTGSNGERRLEPLMIKAVAGQATALADEEVSGPSYLLLTQLDAQNKPCGPALRIPHPLVQDVEAPAAEGTGALQRQRVTLMQAEFFVRLVRQPQARAVRLEEVDPKALKPISSIFPLPK